MAGQRTRIIALAVVFVLAAAGASVFAQATKVYKHKQYKYSVSYPADFQIKQLGSDVSFNAAPTSNQSDFAPNVNILSQTFSTAVPPLSEFYKQAKQPLLEREPPVKIIEEKKDKVGGIDSQRLVYTRKEKKSNFKFLQEIFIHKSRAYVITYTALAEQYDRFLPRAQAIIKSFQFSD